MYSSSAAGEIGSPTVFYNLTPFPNATLSNPHCFVRGTLLQLADGGEVAVESVKIGDILQTVGGASAVMKTGMWMSQVTEPTYKIVAGERGAKRDLFLSKWHKVVLADGGRLPAKKVLPLASAEELKTRECDGALQFFHAQVENGADLIAEGGCIVESWNGVM